MKVIVAGAGGAAHLPGMLASVTPLPVIGVPVPLRHLDGMDSLLSIVQMPAGVPVATVSVGGARNAGLLAVRILAASDPELQERMLAFQGELREKAVAKGEALRRTRRRTASGSAPEPCRRYVALLRGINLGVQAPGRDGRPAFAARGSRVRRRAHPPAERQRVFGTGTRSAAAVQKRGAGRHRRRAAG